MKISIKRSGGFAGLESRRDIDTAMMEASEASKIEHTVHSAGFFDLPTIMPGGMIGADQYHYEMTIIEDDRQHTVAFDSPDNDDSLQIAPLRKLLDTLRIDSQDSTRD